MARAQAPARVVTRLPSAEALTRLAKVLPSAGSFLHARWICPQGSSPVCLSTACKGLGSCSDQSDLAANNTVGRSAPPNASVSHPSVAEAGWQAVQCLQQAHSPEASMSPLVEARLWPNTLGVCHAEAEVRFLKPHAPTSASRLSPGGSSSPKPRAVVWHWCLVQHQRLH